jgi:Tol biopolymer transport system component
VTGSYPVSGSSLEEVREAHARGRRTRLRDLRADLPQVFVRAIEQAIEPDGRRRFQTAGEMEAALESAGRAEPAPSSRLRWLAAAGIAVFVLGAVGGVSLLQGGGTAPADVQAGPTALTSRRLDPPSGVWPFTNPSDDGRLVAGVVEETGEAALVDLTTQEVRRLGVCGDDGQSYASMGLMSPDGRFAAIDCHDDRGGNLYIVGTDGARPRLLQEAPGDVWPFQWSRDGSMILGIVERPGRPTVVGLVAVSDGAVRAIAEVGRLQPVHMALSADNRYIAYDAPETSDASERDLFILDAHTGEQWPLERSPGEDVDPFWTPDGRGVVFLSDRNRNPSLWFSPLEHGRLSGPSQLLKDGVGRVFCVASRLQAHCTTTLARASRRCTWLRSTEPSRRARYRCRRVEQCRISTRSGRLTADSSLMAPSDAISTPAAPFANCGFTTRPPAPRRRCPLAR